MRHPAPWAAVALLLTSLPVLAGELAATDEDRLWLHRNLGAAHLDNDSFEEGAVQLGQAAELAPQSVGDLRNAGIASLPSGANRSQIRPSTPSPAAPSAMGSWVRT